MSEQNLFDVGVNMVRPPLVTVPGAAIPWPYGGKQRLIQIDLDVAQLQARGLSAQDVSNALAAQNLILPVGTQKIDQFEYTVRLNNAPIAIAELGNLPVKVVNGNTIFIRDVANVHDGNSPQTNIVHVDGGRSVLMSVLKNGSNSTLAIVDGVKAKLESIKPSLPDNLTVSAINDQSIFVRAAISGVAVEGLIAAALTSLMILLFLGSWRSTLIIAVSIPLSIMGAIVGLSALGETLNIMTLGGLALAVGILVDDATVTIENINWHLEQGKEVLAIPGSIHSTQAKGCHALIKQGAKLVESAQDVLEELRLPDPFKAATLAVTDASGPYEETPEDQGLLVHLGFDPVHLDALQARCGLDTARLQAQLLTLELDGWVARLPGGLFQRMGRG